MPANPNYERLERTDWIEAAFDLLVDGSIEAVRVERLARIVGVTKGSFYWHFKDRPAFLEALLQTWRQTATLAVIDRLERARKTPEEILKRIIANPYSNPKSKRAGQIEIAIRGWARRDEMAATAVREVDEIRLRYGTSLMQNMGLDKHAAHARSYLIYAYNLAELSIRGGETAAQRKRRHKDCAEFLEQMLHSDE